MDTSRRDFMKLVGISMASLLLTRCRGFLPITTCYAPVPTTPDPESARDSLRSLWLELDAIAQHTLAGDNDDNWYGQQLVDNYRWNLDVLIASGGISAPVADLVQEAYEAAVYHVWRSNAPITCYEPSIVDYAPAGADLLVRQSEILNGLEGQGTIDPATLANAQAALEHDLSYYALDDAGEQALYDEILKAYSEQGQPIPSFDALQLEITPEAQAAAQFIVELLAGK
jgi:hypothetical protein